MGGMEPQQGANSEWAGAAVKAFRHPAKKRGPHRELVLKCYEASDFRRNRSSVT